MFFEMEGLAGPLVLMQAAFKNCAVTSAKASWTLGRLLLEECVYNIHIYNIYILACGAAKYAETCVASLAQERRFSRLRGRSLDAGVLPSAGIA